MLPSRAAEPVRRLLIWRRRRPGLPTGMTRSVRKESELSVAGRSPRPPPLTEHGRTMGCLRNQKQKWPLLPLTAYTYLFDKKLTIFQRTAAVHTAEPEESSATCNYNIAFMVVVNVE